MLVLASCNFFFSVRVDTSGRMELRKPRHVDGHRILYAAEKVAWVSADSTLPDVTVTQI